MRLPALAHRDFRIYQTGNFISNVGNRMQFFAILYQVYHITHSNSYVGALGLVKVVPLLALGLYGGVIADHFDRRKVLLIGQVGMLFVAIAMALITLHHVDSVWPIYGIVFISSIARAFNAPSRQAMLANLVPAEDFPNAASINGVAWRLSDLLGPVFTGVLLALPHTPYFDGLVWVYILNAASFLAVIVAVYLLPSRPPSVSERAEKFSDVLVQIKAGFGFFREAHVVRNTMIVDFWATFFAGAEALLPAYAHLLGLGSRGYGILASATGAGALIASTAIALMPTLSRQGLWVLRMVGLFGIATILYGFSTNIYVAYVLLACIGATDMVSTVLRQTIRQLSTPDYMRGRLGSIGMLFQTSGPQLGDSEAGFAADIFKSAGLGALGGVRASIVTGGLGALCTALWWMRRSHLVRYDRHRDDTAEEGQEEQDDAIQSGP